MVILPWADDLNHSTLITLNLVELELNNLVSIGKPKQVIRHQIG
tara:strand:- start:118 stop:249 length:132 start_codon:yes stop_codon:yes gene_type:complete